jgi:amino acid transporter
VCCLAIETSTIRLCFGMARDDALPISPTLRKVNPKWHTPVGSCVAIGILAAVPFIQYAGVFILAIAATGMIYLSYLIANVALLRARLRGWPKSVAPFSLGRWGMTFNVLALAYGGSMLVNIAWPRVATNPTPYEAALDGKLQLNFGWNWLNHQPVLWTVAITIALVGAVYFVLVQRKKPVHLQAPEDEVFAADVAPAAPAPTG